jgi:hypothetical protein
VIIAEEQHRAVFAVFKPHRRTFKDGPCIHSTRPILPPPTASLAASVLIRAQVYNRPAPRPKQICRQRGVRGFFKFRQDLCQLRRRREHASAKNADLWQIL